MKVVLLEDDQRCSNVQARCLNLHPDIQVVKIVSSGEDCLAFLRNNTSPIHVVLIDIKLTKGNGTLNGIQTAKIIMQEISPLPRLYFLTGADEDEYSEDAQELGIRLVDKNKACKALQDLLLIDAQQEQ